MGNASSNYPATSRKKMMLVYICDVVFPVRSFDIMEMGVREPSFHINWTNSVGVVFMFSNMELTNIERLVLQHGNR